MFYIVTYSYMFHVCKDQKPSAMYLQIYQIQCVRRTETYTNLFQGVRDLFKI